MRIISVKRLREFWRVPRHSDSEQPIKAWYQIAKNADWRTPADVKASFRNASVIGGNRIVFNVAGNKYRMVVKFNYSYGIGYVRFVGTHAQYDKVDVESV